VLGAIKCADNLAVLHSDPTLMPRRRGVWSAWNYLSDSEAEDAPVSLTYWMNLLQDLRTATPLFVTLNPSRMPDPALVHQTRVYRHPQFDAAAAAAQIALPTIQGVDRLWFAGAWTGWGFHEDGIAAAVRVAEGLGVPVPWRSATPSRIAA
jgi:predicted NAD/FAD-binding protein